jgi:Icc protein
MFRHTFTVAALTGFVSLLWLGAAPPPDSASFRFVILGDRTGESHPGVYEHVWKDLAAQNPAFIVGVGDTIQGTSDATAEAQWQEVEKTLAAWKRFPLYLAPGNHDIWSARSAQLFEQYAGHPLHYSFDYAQAHFTVLDNSRSDQLPAAELAFLNDDLSRHQGQPLKFIISHRPSWLLNAILNDSDFELQRIAEKYGARYVIAGHLHELLHAELNGVTYVSVPSAGGHFRGTAKYADGWLFGYTVADVDAKTVSFRVHELGPPDGQGRVTNLGDWGKAGLVPLETR